ncbi:MAG: phage portal protein [Fusobacteriaceae bacterium]
MNLLDKMISYVSPSVGIKRELDRKKLKYLNYANHGASFQKNAFKGFKVSNGGAVKDIEDNIEVLRARSRELYMGTPLATGAINKIKTNVVGSGLIPKSSIDTDVLGMTREAAEALEKNIEAEFKIWAESTMCDATRTDNFYQLQEQALTSSLINGDCFAVYSYKKRKGELYGLKINLIEGDRVTNPNANMNPDIINGIEYKDGELYAYHVANNHPGDHTITDFTAVKAYGEISGEKMALHLYRRERIGQRRGVPLLAPVIEALLNLGRYTTAELTSAVIGSLFTAVIETESEDSDDIFGNEAISEDEQVDKDNENSYELGHGTILELEAGQKMKEINPGRANTGFDLFVKAVAKQVGSAIELPYEVLLSSFEKSYSASRAALLEAWKMFRARRTWMTRDFCQPIYEMFLTEAVASGRINAPGFFLDKRTKDAYCKAEWYGPSQGQLDPLKEVMASAKKVEFGFSTYSRETAELTGMNWDHNCTRREVENRKIKKGGLDNAT